MITVKHYLQETDVSKEKKTSFKRLGEGTYGIVYESYWQERKVAIKKVALKECSHKYNKEQQRFVKHKASKFFLFLSHMEQVNKDRDLKKLDHINILKLFHVDCDDVFQYFYLELCEATIDDYNKAKYKGPMPSSEALSLYQMVSGLAYIHQHELVHCNIKEKNVLICKSSPKKVQLKISDFGLSRLIPPDADILSVHNYLSPELLAVLDHQNSLQKELLYDTYERMLEKKIGISNDIFALGCVFFSFLTKGEHLFASSKGLAYTHENVRQNIHNLTTLEDDFFKSMIKDMIAFSPENRSDLLLVQEKLLPQVRNLLKKELNISKEIQTPVKLLGKGNFNIVYQDTWKEKKVAVKRVDKMLLVFTAIAFSPTSDIREKEEPMKKLSHPNVVKLLHVESDKTFKYYYLELCEATIEDFFYGIYKGPMPSPEAFSLYQMASGLAYIHQQDMVHGDIRDTNVLIYKTATDTQLKISEFGFSAVTKFICNNCRNQNSNKDLQFLSPELKSKLDEPVNSESINDRQIDVSVDIFALGVVFYRFLTKRNDPSGKLTEALTDDVYKSIITGMTASEPKKRSSLRLVTEKLLQKARMSGDASVFPGQLGSGAYGFVYGSSWQGIKVAVKKIAIPTNGISVNLIGNGNQDEEEVMKKLDHPNVLKLWHVTFDDKFKYLYLELCEASVHDYNKGNYKGPMPSSEALSLYQMASGLAYIHEQGLVHRDIKEDNVLIYKLLPNTAQLKISDFGFTKPISPSGNYSLKSGIKGTKNYMSPELLTLANNRDIGNLTGNVDKKISAASDIFALGCVFFSFLTKGRHPFNDSRATFFIPENILKNRHDVTPLPDEFYQSIVKGMIASEPEKRTNLDLVLQNLALQLETK